MKNEVKIIVYSGSTKKPQEILDHVFQRFGINLSTSDLTFIPIRNANLLNPSNYPRFTMLF